MRHGSNNKHYWLVLCKSSDVYNLLSMIRCPYFGTASWQVVCHWVLDNLAGKQVSRSRSGYRDGHLITFINFIGPSAA